MAGKKKKEDLKEDATAKEIAEFLNTDFDGFTVVEAGAYEKVERIPTGLPDLDKALGGGWARGKIIELYGAEGSGKTWVLSKTYAENQPNGMICAHFDLECSYNMEFAEANGVELSNLLYKSLGENDYAENVFEQIEQICRTKKVGLIGIDSVAALIPKAEFEGKYEDKTIGLVARCMSQSLRKLSSVASMTNTTIVFINQTRTAIGKFSPFGTPMDTPGGKALKFFTSQRCEISKTMPNKDKYPELFDEEGDVCGHILKAKITKNKTYIPFKKCDLILPYVPLDVHHQIVQIAMNEVLIEKNPKNHKKLSYKENEFTIKEKNNHGMIWDYLVKNKLAVDMVVTLGQDHKVERLIEDGHLTQQEVDEFYNPPKKPKSEENNE